MTGRERISGMDIGRRDGLHGNAPGGPRESGQGPGQQYGRFSHQMTHNTCQHLQILNFRSFWRRSIDPARPMHTSCGVYSPRPMVEVPQLSAEVTPGIGRRTIHVLDKTTQRTPPFRHQGTAKRDKQHDSRPRCSCATTDRNARSGSSPVPASRSSPFRGVSRSFSLDYSDWVLHPSAMVAATHHRFRHRVSTADARPARSPRATST